MDFLKNNKRFSFKLGDKNVWDLDYKSEITQSGDTLTTTYLFEGGLKVTNIAKKYDKFDAYEWVNYIENTSHMPTDIISELWDCNCTLPLEHEDPRKMDGYWPDVNAATKIYAPIGSVIVANEFYCDADVIKENKRINHIYPGMTKKYSASEGRSSEYSAPFFNIHKNGGGYIFAIGWTGQWNFEAQRTEDAITFKSKIEDTYFKMLPGEKFRTSSVLIMAYEGDETASQNKWRRLIKEQFSPIGTEAHDKYAPFCANVWGGMKSEYIIDLVEEIKKHHLPFEYVWMDAGWYGADTLSPVEGEGDGDWASHTGDWRVSPHIHPNGLTDVSKAIHDAGMKFLLWFEPERVRRTTPIASEHPEYFLTCDVDTRNNLMNLGDDNAWNYCFETISNLIEKLQIDCYRQDFNFSPLAYWRANDVADRIGILEIKHINGLYKLWDALIEKFPGLLIDNCASGGRRIDIETLRRSIPMWRSDYYCYPNCDVEALQCHHMNYNTWMPYSGTGIGLIDDVYRLRSMYDSSHSWVCTFLEKEGISKLQDKMEFIKKYSKEYLMLRPYFSEDYYPLTQFSDKSDTWCAMQFDRPSEGDGIVQIFRRENSPYETATISLNAINEESNYLFTDIDGGEFTVSGKQLTEEGLEINISDKRTAKIYFYKSI